MKDPRVIEKEEEESSVAWMADPFTPLHATRETLRSMEEVIVWVMERRG